MTEEMNTACPFCGYRHELVTAASGGSEFPDDGDITICFGCGQVCVFDSDVDGGLRKPTKKEQHILSRDEAVLKIQSAWKTVKQGH